jgi:polyhydroxyalkanoate synthesis repressor PhaR
MTTTTTKQPKVIKRYANRKLYDTERSCYVTLEEIAQMIKEGDDVKVVDNKTKDDLTAVTLAQIIVEEEKKVQKMPLKLLRSIIQSGPDIPDWKGALGDFYADRVADPVKRLKDDVERRVDSLLKRDGKDGRSESTEGSEAGEGSRLANGANEADSDASDGGASGAGDPDAAHKDEVKAGVVKEFVHSTTEAFESWQRRIDERVRDAIGKMGASPGGPRPEVEALRARIEALEARIQDVEARKKS